MAGENEKTNKQAQRIDKDCVAIDFLAMMPEKRISSQQLKFPILSTMHRSISFEQGGCLEQSGILSLLVTALIMELQ